MLEALKYKCQEPALQEIPAPHILIHHASPSLEESMPATKTGLVFDLFANKITQLRGIHASQETPTLEIN